MNITELNNCYKLHRTLERSGTSIELHNAKNSTVQGLTIYGRSEVVDGEIVSVGEGWAVVRLADLTWNYSSGTSVRTVFATTSIVDAQIVNSRNDIPTFLCSTKTSQSYNGTWTTETITQDTTGAILCTADPTITTVSDFVASLGNATLCYQLADPTQGNTIAIKTDDGTGIDGTMAVFETALPLRGVSEAVRDKLTCTADVKQVETVCGKVRLTDLEWIAYTDYPNRFVANVDNAFFNRQPQIAICDAYTNSLLSWDKMPNKHFNLGQPVISTNKPAITVYDTDYTTVSDFVASLGDAELVYELATPVTTPLTTAEISQAENLQTFNPQTNVQNSSTAEMTIKYNRRIPN